ncbi:MAG TPA: bacteriohopanetetrol glucosamine biosynthesis glycosyltransferase HpnI [Candidatus Sulfotelmatobacter sp.]|nr:bacteriohopanetetrol glucosamine biosynthesis glycosyltransferase HpnI [Candidatus Sulfotelmatobacter sp.]
MIHSTARIFQLAAILGCVSSSIYYLLCLWSAAVFLRGRTAGERAHPTLSLPLPPVSILKPLKGTDPDIYESFRSHCLQDYPEYEVVFGVSDPDDPAVASVQQLQREFPERMIRLVVASEKLGANVKVSNLDQMVKVVRYEHLLVNDSDIRVKPDYLRRVVAPLLDQRVGMVTCLYRGLAAPTLGSQLEALGISTDFCPGVLVARQLEGGLHFGLGSTLAFRKAELEKMGGFRSIVDFLADDYELGRRIADLGLQVQLSTAVVETHLPAYDLRGFLAHQLRWARGVRDARTKGYFGLLTTYGVMWGLLALIASCGATWAWAVLGVIVLLRFIVALAVGRVVLEDRQVVRQLWLLPIRDLFAVVVWFASFAGNTVTWRGDRFELRKGRLIKISQ